MSTMMVSFFGEVGVKENKYASVKHTFIGQHIIILRGSWKYVQEWIETEIRNTYTNEVRIYFVAT